MSWNWCLGVDVLVLMDLVLMSKCCHLGVDILALTCKHWLFSIDLSAFTFQHSPLRLAFWCWHLSFLLSLLTSQHWCLGIDFHRGDFAWCFWLENKISRSFEAFISSPQNFWWSNMNGINWEAMATERGALRVIDFYFFTLLSMFVSFPFQICQSDFWFC